MRIEKKIWPESFEKMTSGNERTQVRLADFECRPGDVLVLKEYDPKTKVYTGRTIEKTIADVTKSEISKFYTKEELDEFGLQVISFEQ